MVAWQIFAGLCLLFLILEMVVPSMFFLNFSFGALLTAFIAPYIYNWTTLIIIFAAISLVSLIFLRPILMKKTITKSQETGINAKYIGKTAKVIETITPTSGVITIYDERWQARSQNTIEVGKDVEIERNESLIMYVKEKI